MDKVKIISPTNRFWFVGRHKGSADWVKLQGIHIDYYVEHIDVDNGPQPGDTVIGTLPVHLIAQLNAMGVRFVHLQLSLSNEDRGKELCARRLLSLRPKLVEYLALKIQQVKSENV
ncbi:CRISPR-associated protein Csx16 [Alteromonas ponticola]|uniref:CRISPR-associated protein Csx16 n=1 Tax=Alteromonas aquimaris TaxID=2998417 RepID=A0ABT3P9Z5_9ALTE|nr:CRISPR-associated protein Csx16 [Alteromonas aquimaris]MCW8109600.1 CRISPR-associated protein Csx16 [Alteromonas aquimaris]